MSFLPTQTSTDEASSGHSVAVLPVGSFEQHGDHLPLTTDTLIACIIAREIAEAHALMLLPPVTISCSHEHAAFAGTVSISATTLTAVISDVQESLQQQGIDKLVLVNAHGGNYVLGNIVQQGNVEGVRLSLFPGSKDWTAARESAGMETNNHDDMHAGELETSILLHRFPEVVRDSYVDADHFAGDRSDLLVAGMAKYTTSGVIGKPSAATAEKGKAALKSFVSGFVYHLEALHR